MIKTYESAKCGGERFQLRHKRRQYNAYNKFLIISLSWGGRKIFTYPTSGHQMFLLGSKYKFFQDNLKST